MMQIRTTPAILGHNISKPQQSIQQPQAKVEGSISHAQVRVSASLPKVQIDQTQAFNESGLKTNKAFRDEWSSYAVQKMHESTGRIASQGNALKDIHKGGNPIADNARYNSVDQFNNEFGMVTMPRSGPNITVIEGELDIQVQEGEINQQVTPQKPIIDYQPGKIDRYMEQYNSIEFRYIGQNVDFQV